MSYPVRHALVCTILLLAPALAPAATESAPRAPRGVYTVVNVADAIKQQQKNNPSITTAQLDAYFNGLYQSLLQDPAVAGLTLQVHWSLLNPSAGGATAFFWNYVDDAFQQAAASNLQNPAQTPKTIQFIVSAGFQTPQWVLDLIPSCDPLFQGLTPPVNCGKATFTGFSEGGDSTSLPLPWNPTYQLYWQAFLTALNQRYGSNPAFVSIAVAGPTAASAEIIVPNNNNSNNPQTQFGANFAIAPDDMWRQLLLFQYPSQNAYHNTDQAFIDAWDAAIDTFGQTFSGVTLIVTVGSGLPNLGSNFTIPPAFQNGYCGNPNMDCGAETTILSYFMQPSTGGANAKGTQTSGMEASRAVSPTTNLGINAVKLLAQATATLAAPSAQILGGAQFNTSFSNDPLGEGCVATFPPNSSDIPSGCVIPPTCTTEGCLPPVCIPQACMAPGFTTANLTAYSQFSQVPASFLIPPEQSAYNVLNVYFGGTPVAALFGATPGPAPAPLTYLQIYSPDIQYAEANANAPGQVVETGGATVNLTAQNLIDMASQALAQISEQPLPVPPAGLSITLIHTGNFTRGQTGATYSARVSNAASAAATSAAVTVSESLPAGLTLVSMAGPGWTCSGNICTRGDILNPGASYPVVVVTVNVASNAPSLVTNQATLSGGGSLPAAASDATSIQAGTCSFTLAKSSVTLTQNGTASAGGVQPQFPVTVAITPDSGASCSASYTAASSASWLSATVGASSFAYTALSNPHPSSRAATLTVSNAGGGSAVLTVTETGDPEPLLSRQVRALYQSVLGRDPDAGGFAFWTGSGSAGLGQMLDSFLTSPEAFNADLAVMATYEAATGALPTFAQYIAAAASVRSGAQTLGGLFNSLTAPGYAAQGLYLYLLGRAPAGAEVSNANAAGLATWFQNLLTYPSNTTPVNAPNNEFMNTGVFHTEADHTNRLYIALLYYVILGRDYDAGGYNFWLGIANSGGPGLLFQGLAGYPTRIQILGPGTPNQGFAGSPEFQGLYQ